MNTEFDPEAARLDSLRGTLARVKFHRRLRVTTRVSAAVAVILAAGVAITPRDRPQPSSAVAVLPDMPSVPLTIVRSVPLKESQRIVSVKSPALLVSSDLRPGLILRTPPDAGKSIPRLGEAEFRNLLAARGYGSVEIGGQPPRVFSVAGQ